MDVRRFLESLIPVPAAFQRKLRKQGLSVVCFSQELESSKQLLKPGPEYRGHKYSASPWNKAFKDILVLDGEKCYLVAVGEFARWVEAERIASPMDAARGAQACTLLKAHPPAGRGRGSGL